jgi:hypothetical protein
MPFRIDDYSETTSSPAERDFAALNLLICLPCEMPAQLNPYLIFNRGGAYFSGAENLKIAQLRSYIVF